MRLLIVEDDCKFGAMLHRGLSEVGHQCIWVKEGEQALQMAHQVGFEVILLDILLPGRNGLDVLRALRAEGVPTPVLILTALGTTEDRIAGLSAGADDYLVKPFSFFELRARINAVARRVELATAALLQVGDLQLDLRARRVRRGDEFVTLKPDEVSLLELLMRHAGHVVTRDMLCEHLWQAVPEGQSNVMDVHIYHLRRKIDTDGREPMLHTVPGLGYRLSLSQGSIAT